LVAYGRSQYTENCTNVINTAHAVLSRASAPDHDPDADEVYWLTVFEELGLFNMRDR